MNIQRSIFPLFSLPSTDQVPGRSESLKMCPVPHAGLKTDQRFKFLFPAYCYRIFYHTRFTEILCILASCLFTALETYVRYAAARTLKFIYNSFSVLLTALLIAFIARKYEFSLKFSVLIFIRKKRDRKFLSGQCTDILSFPRLCRIAVSISRFLKGKSLFQLPLC